MKERRSNIEVVADMLRVGEHGAGKTEIMYSANMSHHQLEKYLDWLVERDCLKRTIVDKSRVSYNLTRKGSALLKSIDDVLKALDRRAESKHKT